MGENVVDDKQNEQQTEVISKSVFDDMEYAHKQTIEQLTKENELLHRQVEDYSRVLKNINIQKVQPKQSSNDIINKLMGGIK